MLDLMSDGRTERRQSLRQAVDAPSVLGGWPRTIATALDAQGVNGCALAAQAGIDLGDAGWTRDPAARLPIPAVTRLWQLAVEATGDPCFGLKVSRFVNYPTFHALGAAVLASSTLHAAIGRLIRYSRMISDAATLRLVAPGECYQVIIDVRPAPTRPAHEALDAFLSLFVRIARMLHGDRMVNPIRVALERPEPMPSAAFGRFFRAPVHFSAPMNVLEFTRRHIEAPLPAGNAELARRFDEVVARYLTRLDTTQLVSRVRVSITERLPDLEPTQRAVARGLGLSARTLQRRLAEEGTSFQAIFDDTRTVLARSYLSEGWTVTEVAFMLGFRDTSSFSRAFRRWTGTAPTRYVPPSPEPHSL